MKIKRKVQKNLPQLIEWAWENPKQVERRTFKSDKRDSFGKNAEIYFTNCGHGFYTHRVTDKDTFTVEVEEVVDSNTVLDNVYTVNVEEGTSHTTYYKSKSINEVKTDEINIIYTILQEEAIVLWDSQGGFR